MKTPYVPHYFGKNIKEKLKNRRELRCGELEPVDCEVVVPVNIIPRVPSEAIGGRD